MAGRCQLLAFVVFVIVAEPAFASRAAEGEAIAVSGDELVVDQVQFRLDWIDAFAPGQPCFDVKGNVIDCGIESMRALRDIVNGRAVTCIEGRGRRRATCATGEGVNLADEMVRRGWALVRPDFAGGDARRLCSLEAHAKFRQRGVWRYGFALPYIHRGGSYKERKRVSGGNASIYVP